MTPYFNSILVRLKSISSFFGIMFHTIRNDRIQGLYLICFHKSNFPAHLFCLYIPQQHRAVRTPTGKQGAIGTPR